MKHSVLNPPERNTAQALKPQWWSFELHFNEKLVGGGRCIALTAVAAQSQARIMAGLCTVVNVRPLCAVHH